MINSLYQLTNKGSLRTLSFILALTLTIFFFFNVNHLAVIWGVVILWIHGIGFEIRTMIWRTIFMPWVGYVAGIISLFNNLLT